jgi:hypothetical protein
MLSAIALMGLVITESAGRVPRGPSRAMIVACDECQRAVAGAVHDEADPMRDWIDLTRAYRVVRREAVQQPAVRCRSHHRLARTSAQAMSGLPETVNRLGDTEFLHDHV